jgi:hypothetical protein
VTPPDTPNCCTTFLNAVSVIPAIGARKTFPLTSSVPIFIQQMSYFLSPMSRGEQKICAMPSSQHSLTADAVVAHGDRKQRSRPLPAVLRSHPIRNSIRKCRDLVIWNHRQHVHQKKVTGHEGNHMFNTPMDYNVDGMWAK